MYEKDEKYLSEEGNRSLGDTKLRWKENIKIGLNVTYLK
jgi:hypothetical protein